MIRFLLFHIFTRCQHCFNYHNRNLFSLSIFFCNIIIMLYWGQLLLQLSQDVVSTNSKEKSYQLNSKKVRLYQQKKQPFWFYQSSAQSAQLSRLHFISATCWQWFYIYYLYYLSATCWQWSGCPRSTQFSNELSSTRRLTAWPRCCQQYIIIISVLMVIIMFRTTARSTRGTWVRKLVDTRRSDLPPPLRLSHRLDL